MSDAEFIKSTLRIFLSVDIVGSTAFKQGAQKTDKDTSSNRPAEPWFDPIVQFYREVERIFTTRWQHYCKNVAPKHSWPTGAAPEFWKGAGDELIYTKVLADHREALVCIHTWMEAINEYRAAFRRAYPSLDLKSAAWLAGFPVHNAEVFFRSSVSDEGPVREDDDAIFSNLSLLERYYAAGSDRSIIRDFIGPSMDTGFRLAEHATPRKLVVSVDLALMLVHASRTQESGFDYKTISFHYDGRVSLRGVFGGTPYPLLWIDMAADSALETAEDRLSDNGPVDSDRVIKFCELFVKSYPTFIFRPYILGNRDVYFSEMPRRHEERLARLRDYWVHENEKRKSERDSGLQPPGKPSEHVNFDKVLEALRLAILNASPTKKGEE